MKKFSISIRQLGDQFSNCVKGFTLTEMIIVVTIFVLIVVAVFSAQALSQRTFREGERAAEIIQNGRVILERMTREIRQATELVTELADEETGATSTIEFEDGHTPVPPRYQGLGSKYYYIYYSIAPDTKELKRQYRVYCFDNCDFANCQPQSDTCTDVCPDTGYHRWNTTRETAPTSTHPCVLEERTIGEYLAGLGFWGWTVINVSTTLEKENKIINLRTRVFGRNL